MSIIIDIRNEDDGNNFRESKSFQCLDKWRFLKIQKKKKKVWEWFKFICMYINIFIYLYVGICIYIYIYIYIYIICNVFACILGKSLS